MIMYWTQTFQYQNIFLCSVFLSMNEFWFLCESLEIVFFFFLICMNRSRLLFVAMHKFDFSNRIGAR